jgi:CHASE2 domain-containing sensor protein
MSTDPQGDSHNISIGSSADHSAVVSGDNNQVSVTQNTIIQHLTEDKDRAALNERLKACTVKVTVPGQLAVMTGFFIAPGEILTCAQGVKQVDGQPLQVSWQDQTNAEASVSELFLALDLAVLTLNDTTLKHGCVYLDNKVNEGDELYTFGYAADEFAQGGYIEGYCDEKTENSPQIITLKSKHLTSASNELPQLVGSPLLNWKTLKVCGMVKATRRVNNCVIGEAISTQAIFEKVNDLKDKQLKFHQKDRRWSNLLPLVRCKPRTVGLTSLVVTILVVLVRSFQVFQPLELGFYDSLMRSRLTVPKLDDRFLIIKVTQQDAEAQQARGEDLDYSLSNTTLTRLLEKVETLNPLAIGLDIYRDRPLDPVNDQRLKQFYLNSNFFAPCKSPYGDDQNEVAPPPDMGPEQVGFSDFSIDGDGILRRQLLAFSFVPTGLEDTTQCQASRSFNLLLAEYYLQTIENIQTTIDFSKGCQIRFSNGVALTNLQANTGGYQGYSGDSRSLFAGCQTMLSYRDQTDLQDSIVIGLEQFLDTDIDVLADNYENRIVLIGIDRTDGFGDNWRTPYSQGNDTVIPGVILQAHMIDQVIDAALQEQPLIWMLSPPLDLALILVFALMGGGLSWWVLSLQKVGLVIVFSCGIVLIMSFAAFQFNGWVPLMPHFWALSITSGYVWWSNTRLQLKR